MSKSTDIAALFDQYVMRTYAPTVTLVRGHGCKVWDADKKTYLDFTAGIAVQNVGHCHPKVVKAIQEQAAALIHCSNLFYSPNQALLAPLRQKASQAEHLLVLLQGDLPSQSSPPVIELETLTLPTDLPLSLPSQWGAPTSGHPGRRSTIARSQCEHRCCHRGPISQHHLERHAGHHKLQSIPSI